MTNDITSRINAEYEHQRNISRTAYNAAIDQILEKLSDFVPSPPQDITLAQYEPAIMYSVQVMGEVYMLIRNMRQQ